MSKYKLMKISAPGWEEDFEDMSQVLAMLLPCICSMCMINDYNTMRAALEDSFSAGVVTSDDIITELECCCISEEYESFNDEDKVYELLSTACGCEYNLEVS